MRGRWLAVLLLATLPAVADAPDARGWSAGTVASGLGRVLGPMPQRVELDLPAEVADRVAGPTLVVYFSPGCPHCQAVAPELAALAVRLTGKLAIVGVASGYSLPADVDLFKAQYDWDFPVVIDTKGKVAEGMGVRSTPAAVLVRKDGKDVVVVDFWYPYVRGTDTLVAMRVLPDPWKAFVPGEYAGNATCAACHAEEYESWGLTRHSVAWKALWTAKKTDDAACVKCHVTGFEAPGGWDGDLDSPMVDVGCEACHGSNGPHDGTRDDARAACLGCHDEDHSIGFTVDKGVPHIDHFRAAVLDEAAFAAERRKLLDGEVPRAMLAFQEGKTVGVQACAGCHPAEVESWRASPHAKAMVRLADAPAADASCVRCHATRMEAGPPASSIADYRTAESVGCEACHGPGERHVAAAGAAGTIEGLGEDCPVCVIEALCTSCHTSEWDPTWNLDAKLPKVGH